MLASRPMDLYVVLIDLRWWTFMIVALCYYYVDHFFFHDGFNPHHVDTHNTFTSIGVHTGLQAFIQNVL